MAWETVGTIGSINLILWHLSTRSAKRVINVFHAIERKAKVEQCWGREMIFFPLVTQEMGDGDSGILRKNPIVREQESNLRPSYRLLVRMLYHWVIGDSWEPEAIKLGSRDNCPARVLHFPSQASFGHFICLRNKTRLPQKSGPLDWFMKRLLAV